MSEQINRDTEAAATMADPHLLTERLGSTEDFSSLGAIVLSGELTKIQSVEGLSSFLTGYWAKTNCR
jgi:hypothetical protein